MLYPLLVSSIAGVSTAIGAIFVIISSGITDKGMAISQGFAAGVMLTVSLVDIIPESFEKYYVYMNGINAFKAVMSLFCLGWIMGMAVSRLAVPEYNTDKTDKIATAQKMAVITTVVMVFHNMPEGVLTFFSSTQDIEVGLKMAIAVALHNIPEGMAIAAPVLYVTKSRLKAFIRAFLAGMAEPAGGVVAYLVLQDFISEPLLNGIMPVVAGVMCQAAVCQLIPESFRISKIQHTLYGIIGGIIAMSIGLLMI